MEPNISRRSFLKRSLVSSVALSLGIPKITSAKNVINSKVMSSCINRTDCHCYAQNGDCLGTGCEYYELKNHEAALKRIYEK